MGKIGFSPIRTRDALDKALLFLRLRKSSPTIESIDDIRDAIKKPALISTFENIIKGEYPHLWTELKNRNKAIKKKIANRLKPIGSKPLRSVFRYKRVEYEDHSVYVSTIIKYINERYANKSIFLSDLGIIKNKFLQKDNPEYWKIEEEVQRYIDNHNHNIYIQNIKNKSQEASSEKTVPLEERVFSWENIIFEDGFIKIKDGKGNLLCSHKAPSKKFYNNLITYFMIQFEDLEIHIKKGKAVFNNQIKFNNLLLSIDYLKISSFTPDLEITPKPRLYYYFSILSDAGVKSFVLKLKQRYLSYLCQKQLDTYRIHYTVENRVNMENEALENAFLFTISESYNHIRIIYENVEDSRSSIMFLVTKEEYGKAIKNICAFFTSGEVNKRETLTYNYVTFKNSGIIRFKRIYHTDFNQWKREIDSLSY